MHSNMVSIIVPVYNCKEYLDRCIKSILGQTYKNLEVILIDDGSTDASSKICDSYKAKDKRVQVFHIKNLGVSGARNYGLKKAKGAYIQFIDGDDYIKVDMTEKLLKELEKEKADLVVCGFIKETPYFKRKNKSLDKHKTYDAKGYFSNILKDPFSYYYGVVWNKLYKRRIITEKEIIFNSLQKLGEDFLFTLEYLKYCSTIRVLKKGLYYYNCRNTGSLSRYEVFSIEKRRLELENRKVIQDKLRECASALGIYEKWEVAIYWYLGLFYLLQKNDLKYSKDKELAFFLEELKKDKRIIKSLSVVPKRLIRKEERIFKKNHFRGTLKKLVKKFFWFVKNVGSLKRS